MTDRSFPYPPHVPLFIPASDGSYGAGGPCVAMTGGMGGSTTLTWPSANLALYFPIWLPWNYPVKRVFWGNAATATGNVDLGIFTPTGTKLMSLGATAASGTNVVQYATVDWLIPAGAYYLGISLSSGSGTVISMGTSVLNLRQCGVLQQATAHPLPSTMVGATLGTANSLVLCGLTRTTTGF